MITRCVGSYRLILLSIQLLLVPE